MAVVKVDAAPDGFANVEMQDALKCPRGDE